MLQDEPEINSWNLEILKSCQTTSSKHFNLKNLGFHINGGSEGLSSEAVVFFKSQIVKYEN